jgi:glycosyltransferase involved in cell wall biosynthesis
VTSKLAILTEIIAPYRIPVFNALAQRPEIDLHVIFLSENDPTLREWRVYKDEIRFRYTVLRSWRIRFLKYKVLLNRGVHSTLNRFQPDVVMCGGYNYPASWSAAYWAKARSVPFLLWTESTAFDLRSLHSIVESTKRRFLNLCTAFVVPGKSSLHYLKQLGIAEQRITTAPNAVDVDLFARLSDSARAGEPGVRARHSLPSRYFLYVGRLVKAKGVFDLLDAYAQLAPEIRSDVGLVFAGDGFDRRELVARAEKTAPGKIYFPGFIHREELPEVYALADALIFPTHSDPWGLVVNEAMACGLPVISTNVAGCALDLVHNGDNGFAVSPCDPAELRIAMQSLASDDARRKEMGRRSSGLISRYSPAAWAQGVVEAVNRARHPQD